MERADFDDLVQSIEERFHGRVEALTRHTWLWLFAGHAAVVLTTFSLLAGGAALFVLCMAAEPIYAIWLVLGGAILVTLGLMLAFSLLMIDLPEPEGRRLKPNEAPQLRALLRDLQTRLDCRPIDEIILTDDFNAGVAQFPRLGFFGWTKSFLLVGMPLLMATSPEEMRSVLAHECAHLSRRHGRHGSRIYHLHRTWEQLFDEVHQQSTSSSMRALRSIMLKFLEWFWPRFHARASVLSRQHEYEADAISAQVADASTVTGSLWRIDSMANMIDEHFWKEVWRETDDLSQPPADLCDRLQAAIASAAELPTAPRWSENALSRATQVYESHPSLSQRIEALGQSVDDFRTRPFPLPHAVSAAEVLLAPDCASLQQEINAQWRQNANAVWTERHRRTKLLQRLTEEAQASSTTTSQTPAELWSRISQTWHARGLDAAEPLIRQLLAIQPEHLGATYLLANQRLSDAPQEGEDLLRHVFESRDEEWSHAAGVVLEQHYSKVGRTAQMKQIRQELDQLEKDRAAAAKELTDFRPSNTFVPHGLTDADLAPLVTVLTKREHCELAWLARKQLQHFPNEKLFVLCVDASTAAGKKRREQNEQLTTSLLVTAHLPGRVFVVNPTGEFRRVAQRIMKSPGSRIFERTTLPKLEQPTK